MLRKRFVGITLWPFVIIKQEGLRSDTTFINHERIHLRQQIELGILPFYILYALEFIIRLCMYGDRFKAYRNISFEREAYANEEQLDYLNGRAFWSFIKFY